MPGGPTSALRRSKKTRVPLPSAEERWVDKGFRKEDLLLIGLVMFLILGDNDECEKPCDDDRQDNSDLLLILALILLLS